jgi:GNAT superfamily N-acetyltransferase
MFSSRAYTFVRSRQLENTYPGDPRLGNWGISVNRIVFGWGRVEESDWPYFESGAEERDFNAPEPSGVDKVAKRHRIHYYERVRDSVECRKVLKHNRKILDDLRKQKQAHRPRPGYLEIKGGFEISRQFLDAPQGILLLPPSDVTVIGAHAVPFIRDLASQRALEFVNSWGPGWGDHGIGYMPYDFFDQWLVEAWAIDESSAQLPQGQGVQSLNWNEPDVLGGRLHGLELYDGDADERIGWAFAAERGDFLDLEELFVRPAYRGRGHGNRLAEMVLNLSRTLKRPIRAWIPFADCDPGNRPALGSIIAKLDLGVHRSGVAWAAYQATADEPKVVHFPVVRIPPRPGRTSEPPAENPEGWETLRAKVVAYEDPFGPAVPAEDWEAMR